MMTRKSLYRVGIATGLAMWAAVSSTRISAGQQPARVTIDNDDIGGVVTSTKGPEAGVWVIAETKDLPTGFRRIVVTDDRGRYLVPDVPKGSYDVWVRGYGLVDSAKVKAQPGAQLNLTAVVAPDARAAAEYYPANYWYSLLQPPAKSEFPGTGLQGNGISENIKTQLHYMSELTLNGCVVCHQMGTKVTRSMPKNMGTFASPVEAWDRRVQSGQSGSTMSSFLARFGRKRALEVFADWTSRIEKGELPPQPPRPQGVERNVVVTQWDWAANKHDFVHDEIASDKRHPTVNGNGPVYGAPEYSTDPLMVLDPKTNVTTYLTPPFLDPKNPPPFAWTQQALQPSPVWGGEAVFTSKTSPHSLQMDQKSRLWVTSTTRPSPNPDFCKQGSEHPSAKFFPLATSSRQLSMYDPASKQFVALDTCYGTHHVVFDSRDRLWMSTLGQTIAWFDTKEWDQTHDVKKAQGWAPFVLDTNGNGKLDLGWAEPNQPVDPTKDKRIGGGGYGIAPDPNDPNIIWAVSSEGAPGSIYRVSLGANPPQTTLSEVYQVPYQNPEAKIEGVGTRGIDIDLKGLVWAGLGNGYVASFDRKKCKAPLNGPKATGQHCPEGWTLHKQPGPTFKGTTEGNADANYYTFVDQHNTSGLGANIPFTLGNNSDSLKALMPDGKTVFLRVPYPMGLHPKGMDGRIDDPNAGWKGRGVWTSYGGQVMWHMEGGKEQGTKIVKLQVRPDPLAK